MKYKVVTFRATPAGCDPNLAAQQLPDVKGGLWIVHEIWAALEPSDKYAAILQLKES